MRTGRQATDAQVKELRNGLQQGASLAYAAMKADMDRKTARKYRDRGRLPSETPSAHTRRTRHDPLVEVWPRLEELLHGRAQLRFVGRPPNSSPAEGSTAWHAANQRAIIEHVFEAL